MVPTLNTTEFDPHHWKQVKINPAVDEKNTETHAISILQWVTAHKGKHSFL